MKRKLCYYYYIVFVPAYKILQIIIDFILPEQMFSMVITL